MADFDTGVSGYILGTATVQTYFPIDHRGNEDVNCDQCNFYNMRNRRCNLNQALCPYPTRGRAPECPLELTR